MKPLGWLVAAGLMLAGPVMAGPPADDCQPYYLIPQDQTDAVAAGTSLLMEISHPDHPPSILLGTYHSADPRLRARWDALALLLAAVRPRLLVVERELAADGRGQDPRWLPGDQTLETVLADQPGLYPRVLAAARDYNLPEATLTRARVWMAAGWLNQAPAARFATNRVILDDYLQQQAATQGIPLFPLENLAGLARRYDDFTPREQARLLWEAVCNRPVSEAAIRDQTEAYLANDPRALYRAATGHGASDPALEAKLLDAFVTQRNGTFWDRLRPELERGGLFVALGSLHLFGEGGLLGRLTQEGWRIQPLDPKRLTLTLTPDQMPGLSRWVLNWAREQGLEASAADLADLTIEATTEADLRQRLCPGRPCRVDATYLPDPGKALLTADRLALLAREEATPDLVWQDHRPQFQGRGRGVGEGSHPASLVVREMVRHLLYRAEPDREDDPCRRQQILDQASHAQQSYLLARGNLVLVPGPVAPWLACVGR